MNTAFWQFTINNYTPTDLALVQQGYPDQVRQIVYTLEKGEENGTPHIQGYLKLYRQQRDSFVRKLFPRARWFGITADDYKLNAQRYAQKLDATAESPAVITNNPFPDPVVELLSVIEEAFSSSETNTHYHDRPDLWIKGQPTHEQLLQWLTQVENSRVRRTPRLVRFYVSPTYRTVKRDFLDALKAHFFDTHTHTHTQVSFAGEELSQSVSIPIYAQDEEYHEASSTEEDEEDEVDEDDQDDLESSDGSSEEDSGFED